MTLQEKLILLGLIAALLLGALVYTLRHRRTPPSNAAYLLHHPSLKNPAPPPYTRPLA
jgi:hypothetical protein